MIYSKTGLALTQRFESCKLIAYQDERGVWTIGWGHTGTNVSAGDTITQEQADALLAQDTFTAQECVSRLVRKKLNQEEFDALVDFVFNIGCGAFLRSTMLCLLNDGDMQVAAKQFDEWDWAGGSKVAGLLRRRQDETNEFLGT